MDTNHQLTVRIKAFINSSELINSPTAQELYRAYCELNNKAVQRLVECEVLLEKKQKIEAVVLAQQDPNLFDLIDMLLFPERKDLLILADLYDWTLPNEINADFVENVKKAVSEMDDLRPLLTEFRRIARTDQVKNKLHLLREITRIDKENPEWQLPLAEVENQYVSQVIAEAQKAIQEKDFPRLEEICEELKNTKWVVTVPTIVLQKVEKIVTAYRHEKAKKGAAAILEKINDSFGAFDVIGLDDAMVCWQEHCKEYGYSPDEKEAAQLKEAAAYLAAEKKKQKEQLDFQALLERISALMNSSAPLTEVEKCYAEAQSSGLEIPNYISNRVNQYRIDTEREQRTATIIKGLKILGTAAIIILIVSYAAFWGIQTINENSQAHNLQTFIKEAKIAEAQSLLKDIEMRYPKLSGSPKITQAKAVLQELILKEQDRAAEFAKIEKETAALRKQWPPEPSLKDKIARLEKIAKTDSEKARARQARIWIDEAFSRHANEIEVLFLKKVARLKKTRDEILSCIEKNEFGRAEKLLAELEKVYREITEIPDVSRELLAENNDLLKSVETVRDVLFSRKDKFRELASAQEAILKADNFASLESAIHAYRKLFGKNTDPDELEAVGQWIKELSYFKAILNFQSGHTKTIPAEYVKSAYFQDIIKRREREKAWSAARTQLIAAFDSLQKNTNRRQILFLRFKSGDSNIDIYASSSGISSMAEENSLYITLKRLDGTQVTIKRSRGQFSLRIGDEDYSGCRLEYPARLSTETIKSSRARHQVLIEKIFSELHSMNAAAILRSGISYLDLIRKDDLCAPYWKMKLSLRILEILTLIDLSPDKSLSKIKDELVKIQTLDNTAGDPLDNKFLGEKITLFFKNYDFSVLAKNLAQNEEIQKFSDARKNLRFQCLGFAMMVNRNLQYAICAPFKSVETEVFCFDSKMSDFLLVGRYDKNSLIIDDKYHDQIAGHLLFTSDPADSLSRIYYSLKNNRAELSLQQMVWPDFWPLNMRGDVQ